MRRSLIYTTVDRIAGISVVILQVGTHNAVAIPDFIPVPLRLVAIEELESVHPSTHIPLRFQRQRVDLRLT